MSDYNCYCDYEQPEFTMKTRPVARKPHKCFECNRTIQTGEQYERVAGKWEGYFNVFRLCSHCVDIRDWARISFPCYDQCWAWGNILDDVREYVSEESYKVPGLFFEYGRRVVKAERFRKAALSSSISERTITQ